MDNQQGGLTVGEYREHLARAGWEMRAMGFSEAEGLPVCSVCFTRADGGEGRISTHGPTTADAWREALEQVRAMGLPRD